jgi:hypothetical protein
VSYDAGFAVAITIRERLLNDAITNAHAAADVPHKLRIDSVPGGPPEVAADVFLNAPVAACRPDGALTLTLPVWGTLTVTEGGASGQAHVSAQLVLALRLLYFIDGKKLSLEFNQPLQDIQALQWTLEVLPGSTVSPAHAAYLQGTAFRDRLTKMLAAAVALQQIRIPKIPVDFLGGLLDWGFQIDVRAKVLAGALVLGLDLTPTDASPDVSTAGRLDELDDFAQANDLAAVTSAMAVPLLLRKVSDQITTEIHNAGASLDRLDITPQERYFHIEGSASNDDGSVEFSFDLERGNTAYSPGAAFQYLKKPVKVNNRHWPAVTFTATHVDVDTDPAWWIYPLVAIAGYLTDGVALLPALGMIAMLSDETDREVSGTIANKGDAFAAKVQHLKPSSPAGAVMRVVIEEFEISPDGTYLGMTLRPAEFAGTLDGPSSLPRAYASQSLGYAVSLPYGVAADDPLLKVRWSVLDGTGHVLHTEDGPFAGRALFVFDASAYLADSAALQVDCAVYRDFGVRTDALFSAAIALTFDDTPTAGRYLRWFYDVKNPQVHWDPTNKKWVYDGELRISRHSRLHRADQPCANAKKPSRYLYRLDSLDALPFPLAELSKQRDTLCEYCFYGGPRKHLAAL